MPAEDEALHARQRREAERDSPSPITGPAASNDASDLGLGVEPEAKRGGTERDEHVLARIQFDLGRDEHPVRRDIEGSLRDEAEVALANDLTGHRNRTPDLTALVLADEERHVGDRSRHPRGTAKLCAEEAPSAPPAAADQRRLPREAARILT